MQRRKGCPVPGQLCRPGCSEDEQAAAWTVPREPEQHRPHCIIAAVGVVEDHDDGPFRTSRGEQTGHPLDEVVAKSFRARSGVVGDTGTAYERRKTTNPAPAGTTDSISVGAIRTQIKSIGPGAEGRHTLEETTVRDQPAGELMAVRYQFGHQPRFSQPRVTEHQGHPQLTERAPLLFGPQHCEFPDASRHEKPIAAHVAE
jgi:hypothetical protein